MALLFPTIIAITDPGMNRVITAFFKVSRCLFAQLFNNFYGVDAINKFSENGRLISEPVPISRTRSVFFGLSKSVIIATI